MNKFKNLFQDSDRTTETSSRKVPSFKTRENEILQVADESQVNTDLDRIHANPLQNGFCFVLNQ